MEGAPLCIAPIPAKWRACRRPRQYYYCQEGKCMMAWSCYNAITIRQPFWAPRSYCLAEVTSCSQHVSSAKAKPAASSVSSLEEGCLTWAACWSLSRPEDQLQPASAFMTAQKHSLAATVMFPICCLPHDVRLLTGASWPCCTCWQLISEQQEQLWPP